MHLYEEGVRLATVREVQVGELREQGLQGKVAALEEARVRENERLQCREGLEGLLGCPCRQRARLVTG